MIYTVRKDFTLIKRVFLVPVKGEGRLVHGQERVSKSQGQQTKMDSLS